MIIDVLRPRWPVAARVGAAMTTRHGGISAAPFTSLNLGVHVGDDAAAVTENRRRVRAACALPSEPAWLQQVHGTAVWRGASAPVAPPVADAAVTRHAGCTLAIMVADCLPVLLAADDGSVIGAAHAGWRGLANGVLEAAVAAMQVDGSRIHAWFGPAIRQRHFEVGDEVRAAFTAADGAAASAFLRNDRGRWQCDLARLARQRLEALGVGSISDCELCTFEDQQHFYSHRRDQRTGRQAALVWLRP